MQVAFIALMIVVGVVVALWPKDSQRMTLSGYIRVEPSAPQQLTSEQLEALLSAGYPPEQQYLERINQLPKK